MKRAALLGALCLSLVPSATAQERVPGDTWLRYADPAEGGWSSEGLAEARAFWETLDSAAYLVVDRGVVVAAWGDVERRFMCHSVRKSLLSGLYGVYVDAGTLGTEKTLAALGIDDEPALTEVEKRARIEDLLRARSGVYKLAAYEPPQNPKPARGAHEPGTFWCYNNFDFNTLGTIFEQETGTRIFEEFGRRFAEPLGMQDYRVRDGYYHYERDKSIHPAYPFRMSARDCARFGLLYLYEGAWGDERILSPEWVRRSTASYSDTGEPGGGYGYMWWTFDEPQLPGVKGYTAAGVGGQTISVLPEAGLVIVNRTNTYRRRNVGTPDRRRLMSLILAARDGEPAPEPELVPLESPSAPEPGLEAGRLVALAGDYTLEGDPVRVRAEAGALLLELPSRGTFGLLPVADAEDVFLVEDAEVHLTFEERATGGRGRLASEFELLQAFDQSLARRDAEGALRAAESAYERYPMSATAHVMLAAALAESGDPELARDMLATALEIDPGHVEAQRLRRELAP